MSDTTDSPIKGLATVNAFSQLALEQNDIQGAWAQMALASDVLLSWAQAHSVDDGEVDLDTWSKALNCVDKHTKIMERGIRSAERAQGESVEVKDYSLD